MIERVAAGLAVVAALTGSAAAPQKSASGTKGVMHELTVRADAVYTGTMEVLVEKGAVSGTMRITAPTEITGTVAGTAKGGVLQLDFPFRMTERDCTGAVKMQIPLPSKAASASGTMEAVGCGREPADKLTGTVELRRAEASQAR
jgi:hypothetical protein